MIDAVQARKIAKDNGAYSKDEVEYFIRARASDGDFRTVFEYARWTAELTTWLVGLDYGVEIFDEYVSEVVEVSW